MQCSKAHETLWITICVVSICIGNTEHWSLVMKFMDSIHNKNYISFKGQWDTIRELYTLVVYKWSLSVKKHPQGKDDTNKRLAICKQMQLCRI